MYRKQSSKKCSEDSDLWWHKQPGSTVCPKVNLSRLRPVLPVLNLVKIEFENLGPTENALYLVGFKSSFSCCLKSKREEDILGSFLFDLNQQQS